MESSMTADICFKVNRTNVTFTQNLGFFKDIYLKPNLIRFVKFFFSFCCLILCFLQNSAGEILYSCLTSCKSDFAATTKHGILLSMKCCCKFKEKVKEALYNMYSLEKPKYYWLQYIKICALH